MIEKNSVKSWQAGLKLGARVALTRPGQFSSALEREIELLAKHSIAATYRELPTLQFPLTSQCLCGGKMKWGLSDRVITCPHCGLGPVGRDAFSALKARLVGETGIATLDGGGLNTKDFRAQALEHCGSRLPADDVSAGEGGNRTRDARGVPCQTETSAGQSAELAEAVSDLGSDHAARSARRSRDKRGNTRTHTDRSKSGGRARTSREAARNGPVTVRWLSP